MKRNHITILPGQVPRLTFHRKWAGEPVYILPILPLFTKSILSSNEKRKIEKFFKGRNSKRRGSKRGFRRVQLHAGDY